MLPIWFSKIYYLESALSIFGGLRFQDPPLKDVKTYGCSKSLI